MKVAYILTVIEQLGPFIVAKNIIDNVIDEVEGIDIFYLRETPSQMQFDITPRKIDFFKKIDLSGYDLVHSHGFMADLYASMHVGKKTKWVSTLHQKIYPVYAFGYGKFVAYCLEHFWLNRLKRADAVVGLTNEMREYYLPKLKKVRLAYIYNGIPDDDTTQTIPQAELEKINQLKQKTKLLVVCARIVYLKGIDRIIDMLALSPAYSLLVIGEGEEEQRKLEEQAKQLNVSGRVWFIGRKNNSNDYLKLCDVYIMSSRTEGFGLCVIEAASQKLPVASTNLPVFNEIFDDEIVRFNLDDTQSMLDAINEISANREHYAKKIYERFLQCYTAKVMATSYLQMYELCSRSGA